jgi:uncharacterized protein
MGEAEARRGRGGAVEVVVLAAAMALPALLTWGWQSVGSVDPGFWPLAVYFLTRAAQFSLPIIYFRLAEGRWPERFQLRPEGLAWGLGFGLLVAGVMVGAYFGGACDWQPLREAPAQFRAKAAEHGVASPPVLLAVMLFMVVVHSGLEEYYWRWFVFGRLRKRLPEGAAIVLSALAFMAHHVLDLNHVLPGRFLEATLPLALAVAVGGAFWAWLYGRTRSLTAVWLSHLLVDAGLMVVAWEVLRRAG